MTSPAPSAKDLVRPFMPELDSLRGLAILGVLLLHGFYWQYDASHFTGLARLLVLATKPGWLGVNLFFVLSGFLITGILLDSRSDPRYYPQFYMRRALRILPAYYLLLALLAVLRQASGAYLGLSFFYLANVTTLLGVANDYGPLWSLAVEEQYYIFWPAVVRRMGLLPLGLFSLAVCVIVPVLRAAAFLSGHAGGIAGYTWFVADGLAMGSVLAVMLRTSMSRRRVRTICVLLLSAGAGSVLLGARFGVLTRDNLLGAALQHTTINLIFAGVLLLFLLAGTGAGQRYVNSRVLGFFGYISYGLYLVHMLVFRIYDQLCGRFFSQLQPAEGQFGLVLVRFACAAGASIGLAYVSRRHFENKFLQLKRRMTPENQSGLSLLPRTQARPAACELATVGAGSEWINTSEKAASERPV